MARFTSSASIGQTSINRASRGSFRAELPSKCCAFCCAPDSSLLPLESQPDKLSLVKSESGRDDRPTENPGVGGSIPPLSNFHKPCRERIQRSLISLRWSGSYPPRKW